MNKEQRDIQAINDCITKWKGVVCGTETERADKNCALCALYNIGDNECAGCPVESSDKNGKRVFCYTTPYHKWNDHQVVDHRCYTDISVGRKATCEKCRQIALEEVEFLQSLLPNDNADTIRMLQDELAKANAKIQAIAKIID